jgi:hypothetical protein
MYKKGSIFFAIIIAFLIFSTGVLVYPYLKDIFQGTRTSLNCDTPNLITDGNKLTCLFTDTILIYFLWGVFSLAGGGLLNKLIQ